VASVCSAWFAAAANLKAQDFRQFRQVGISPHLPCPFAGSSLSLGRELQAFRPEWFYRFDAWIDCAVVLHLLVILSELPPHIYPNEKNHQTRKRCCRQPDRRGRYGNAAVTFTIANYTGTTSGNNGIPIVTISGAGVAAGSAFAWIGTFDAGVNFATMVAPQVIQHFNPADPAIDTPVGINPSRLGLFNGADYDNTGNVYPSGLVGQQGYILVTNASTLAGSTLAAVFTLNTVFPAPAGDQTALYTIQLPNDLSSVRYGFIRSVTVQPDNDASPSTFVNGVGMTFEPVPEPTVALLGGLGLLGLVRRRR
jgi:MYXO-CTERM domain-containing protein